MDSPASGVNIGQRDTISVCTSARCSQSIDGIYSFHCCIVFLCANILLFLFEWCQHLIIGGGRTAFRCVCSGHLHRGFSRLQLEKGFAVMACVMFKSMRLSKVKTTASLQALLLICLAPWLSDQLQGACSRRQHPGSSLGLRCAVRVRTWAAGLTLSQPHQGHHPETEPN